MPSGHKLSAAHRVEQALIEEISAGELLPGVRLDEVGLAHRFGVSRTPVREALSRLTAQGVLVPGRKARRFCRGILTRTIESNFRSYARNRGSMRPNSSPTP